MVLVRGCTCDEPIGFWVSCSFSGWRALGAITSLRRATLVRAAKPARQEPWTSPSSEAVRRRSSAIRNTTFAGRDATLAKRRRCAAGQTTAACSLQLSRALTGIAARCSRTAGSTGGRPRAPVATESLAWMAFAANRRPVRLGLRVRPMERASATRATNAGRAVRVPRSGSRRVARLVWIIPKAPVSVVAARTPPSTKGRVASILSATNATARTPFVSTVCALVSPHRAVPFPVPTTRVSSRVQACASWANVKGLPWQMESGPAATLNPRPLNARPNSALMVNA